MRHALAFLLLLGAAHPAAAQVGHLPDGSPYRDIGKKKSLTALGGHLGGNGGLLGVGPHDGMAYGLRYGLAVSGPLEFGFSVSYADLQGALVTRDTDGKLALGGLVPSPVWMFETTLQFTLTGGKTWHRLAPYFGGGAGYARRFSSTLNPDAFDFGGRFYLTPFAGTRVFVNSRSFVRAELHGAFWKLAYPPSYFEDTNGLIPPFTVSDYLSNPWVQVGIGHTF